MMAGGLFERPFEFNVKCIVFTIMISAGYWYAPRRSYSILILTLIVPYIAMAWYDEVYACESQLQPTIVPFGRKVFLPFKPPGYQKRYDELISPRQKKIMRQLDHAIIWTIFVLGLAGALVAIRHSKR
jgi:hypothetical protein